MTLLARQIKDRRWTIVLYCAAGIAFLWIMTALYPSISQEADQFNQLLKSLPQGFLKAFDVEDNALSTFEGFIALRHFSLVWPIMLILLAISLATRGLAGEVEKGTVELLLSRPISRLRVFVSRYMFGLLSIVVFTVVTVMAVWPLAAVHGVALQLDRYLLLMCLAAIFGLALFSLSLMISAWCSEQGRVSMIMGSLLVAMYFLHIVAALKDSLDGLKYFSFFYYFDAQGVLKEGVINPVSLWVFALVIVASLLSGAIIWQKRDY